jgi:hypothetical protein
LCYLRVSGWLTRSASAHRSARSYQQQQVWYDSMQCAPTCVPMSCRTLSQGSPKPQPIGPPSPDAHLPLGRSRNTRVCTPAPCASITQSTFVDHSTPPQVLQYCMPDTLAFISSLSPLISGLHLAAPFFAWRHVMCLISSESSTHVSPPRHPLLQPGTRVPQTTHGARWMLTTTGTPTPRNGFACQPRSCILNPAFRATSASWSATRPAFPSPSYLRSTQRCIIMFHALSRAPTPARSCSCSCLLPCLKALDKLLISFEVRRHDAASCAIRHEYAGCRWLKTPPFGFGSS